MKIVHLCLNSLITDGWTYQDNIMPKYNRKEGHDVTIITSQFVGLNDGREGIDKRNEYTNDDDVKVVRLKCHGRGRTDRLKRFPDLMNAIKNEQPDILFIHSCQFLDIDKVAFYLKKNTNVVAFVDNHADFSNSATNWISKNILHKFIWKKCAKRIEPYVKKFYGVLPARVDFLVNVYDIPSEKCELLVMGADDDEIAKLRKRDTISETRNKFNVKQSDFLIVTGGKIDMAKQQTLLLMDAVKQLGRKDVKLLVFGSVDKQLIEKFNAMLDEQVIYAGWASGEDSNKYFYAADLVCFPGRHSVYWEQVCGMGIPMFVKYWEGTTHVDLGGNVKFLYEDSVDEIRENIEYLLENPEEYNKMKNVAQIRGMKEFSYADIAQRSIRID